MSTLTPLVWRRAVTNFPGDQVADLHESYRAEVGPHGADGDWAFTILDDGYDNRVIHSEVIGNEDAAKSAVEQFRLANLCLVLTDGAVQTGRLQYDANNEPVIDTATCGHCGFTWNDALITGLTPVPSGRCPNEYNHVYEDEDEPTFRVEIHGEYGVNEGTIHLFNGDDEAVMWESTEWIEDPSLVYVIANAIHIGYEQGYLAMPDPTVIPNQ